MSEQRLDIEKLETQIQTLKDEIQTISQNILKLDPHFFKSQTIQQENQALSVEIEELKATFFRLQQEEEKLLKAQSAAISLKIYQMDWPEQLETGVPDPNKKTPDKK